MHIDIELLEKQTQTFSKLNNNKKTQNNANNVSKICNYDFFSINEVKISEKIKEIPYYYNDCSIVEKCNYIKVGEMSEKSRQLLKISGIPDNNSNNPNNPNNPNNNNKKYLLLQYNREKSIKFNEFLFSFNTPKPFIFHVLESYSSLLDIIIKLNDNDVCFFDLSCENIFIGINKRPFLKNFDKSLLLNKLEESYISKMVSKITDYTCKPIEVYVLFYLIMNNEETMSYHFIETIVTFFIDNLGVLTLFTQSFKEKYKQNCIDYLKKYINQPKTTIIEDLIKYYDTWDNYSLSMIYLHIIGNIVRVFGLKDTFMNSFLILLLKNISPDPLKRENREESRTKYDNLFTTFTNWEFINELSSNKMKRLYEVL